FGPVRVCLRMAVFPQKRVDSSVDLQRMPLLHFHLNRVTFSLTSTLPMANSGCLCPVIVAGWRAGRLGVVKLVPITRYGVVVHRQYHVFDGGVAGDRSRPPALAGGVANWQSGQANGLECVLLPRKLSTRELSE